MRHSEEWQQWTSLNRQLMEQWRRLFSSATGGPEASAETQYQQLNAATDDILAVFETGRGCVALSPNWERVTGRLPAACMGGEFYACLQPEHAKPFIAALQQAVTEGVAQLPLIPQHFLLFHATGASRWYALKVVDVISLSNGQQRIVCGLKDVHDAQSAQTRAQDAQREAQRALNARSEFLGSMSHELRTPLNAILGFTQIMETGMYGDIANPQYRDYLRHIRESGYELLAQIDEIMEIATVDSGSAVLQRERCDLHDLLQQALSSQRGAAKTAGVTLTCQVAPNFVHLAVDVRKVQHCIGHIIANAVCFSNPGGTVRLDAEVNEYGELCVRVHDSGVGMSPRKLHDLVVALQKEDSWASRNANGLGLGLALAKEYARLHGGYLTLESKAGAGTSVTIHLPPGCLASPAARPLQAVG